jgi:hypothetical protein
MGIGVSIFLIAVGAVLAFALNVEPNGWFDLDTVGVILMIVGGLGAILSLMFWSSWGGWSRGAGPVDNHAHDHGHGHAG